MKLEKIVKWSIPIILLAGVVYYGLKYKEDSLCSESKGKQYEFEYKEMMFI